LKNGEPDPGKPLYNVTAGVALRLGARTLPDGADAGGAELQKRSTLHAIKDARRENNRIEAELGQGQRAGIPEAVS